MKTHRFVRYGILNLVLIAAATLPVSHMKTGDKEWINQDTLPVDDSAQYVGKATPPAGAGFRWIAFSSERWGIYHTEQNDLGYVLVRNPDINE